MATTSNAAMREKTPFHVPIFAKQTTFSCFPLQTVGAASVSISRFPLLPAVVASLLLHAALIAVVQVEMPEYERPPTLQARLVPMKPLKAAGESPPAVVKQTRAAAKPKRRRPPPVAEAPTEIISPEPAEELAPEPAQIREPEFAVIKPIPESPAVPAPTIELSGNQPSVPLPSRLLIQFTANWGGPRAGRAEFRWEQDGDRYRLQSIGQTTGILALFKRGRVVETSVGTITEAGLRPETFTSQHGDRRNKRASFDWMEKSLKLADNDKIQTLPLAAGTQDIMSFLFQFAFTPPQESMVLALTDGRKVERYRISVLGEETLHLAMGEIKTLHLRKPKTASDDGMDIWLAIDRHFLPVKIRNEPRKDEWPIELVAVEILVQEK